MARPVARKRVPMVIDFMVGWLEVKWRIDRVVMTLRMSLMGMTGEEYI